jgi:hypothetical protein
VYGFALSIPPLFLSFAQLAFGRKKLNTWRRWEGILLLTFGAMTAIGGIAAIFFHFSITAGILFTALVLIGIYRIAILDY